MNWRNSYSSERRRIGDFRSPYHAFAYCLAAALAAGLFAYCVLRMFGAVE